MLLNNEVISVQLFICFMVFSLILGTIEICTDEENKYLQILKQKEDIVYDQKVR